MGWNVQPPTRSCVVPCFLGGVLFLSFKHHQFKGLKMVAFCNDQEVGSPPDGDAEVSMEEVGVTVKVNH